MFCAIYFTPLDPVVQRLIRVYLLSNPSRFFQNIFLPQFYLKRFFTISLKLAFQNIFNKRDENPT